jgi:Tfp pilus assembly protein PilN
MRAVNLLPKEIQRSSAKKPVGPIMIGTLLFALAIIGLDTLHANAVASVSDKQQQKDQLTKKSEKLPKPPAVSDSQRTAATQEDARVSALNAALQVRVPWDVVLRDISFVLPSDVKLSDLRLTAPVPSSAAAGSAAATATGATSGVVIDGFTHSQEGVARFLARLQVMPALTDVTLSTSSASEDAPGSTTTTASAGTTLITFTITAAVKAPTVLS